MLLTLSFTAPGTTWEITLTTGSSAAQPHNPTMLHWGGALLLAAAEAAGLGLSGQLLLRATVSAIRWIIGAGATSPSTMV